VPTGLLRGKPAIERLPVAAGAESLIRVRIELQDEVMGNLRVLVEDDRMMKPEACTAPVPVVRGVRSGGREFQPRINGQYVALQRAARDEIVPDPTVGLQPLTRQQKQWQELSRMVGNRMSIYQAYAADQSGAPRFTFRMVRHEDVETAGARIDLARTVLVLDANGAYRAAVTLSVYNTTEQYLDVELPSGAALWTVHVNGEPVKPAEAPGAAEARHVLLPILKTAPGDLNYPVVLKYGGKMPALGPLASVQFPLVRTVKSFPGEQSVGVERSLVDVYVPEKYQWFDFSRTMHPVAEEAEERAILIQSQTKQAQRLLETTRQGDPFAKRRAWNNLKGLKEQMEETQKAAGQYRTENESLKKEITLNSGALAQVEEQLKEAEKARAPQGAPQAQVDNNRDLLKSLFDQQTVANSRGTVNLSGANTFTGGTNINNGTLAGAATITSGTPATAMGTLPFLAAGQTSKSPNPNFNPGWIDQNKLGNAGNQLSGAGQLVVDGGTLTVGGLAVPQAGVPANGPVGNLNATGSLTKMGSGTFTFSGANATLPPSSLDINPIGTAMAPGGMREIVSGGPTVAFNNGSSAFAQPVAPQLAAQLGKFNRATLPNSGSANDDSGAVLQYQAKLDAQAAKQKQPGLTNYKAVGGTAFAGLGVGGGAMVQPPAGSPTAEKAAAAKPQDARTGGWRFNVLEDSGEATAGGEAAVAPAGLASLDFELPVNDPGWQNRWHLYRFTTPRGEDVELSARAVSTPLLARLGSLLAIVVLVLVLLSFVRFVGRGGFAGLRGRWGAILLAVLGLVSLVAGLLPLVGLACLVIGIVRYIMLRRRKPAMAM
jgi:autotransporter-associated beta strand protein